MLDILETYPLLGQLLYGRYQILKLLSAGVFGQTYLAEDIARPGKPKCVVKQHQPSLHYPNLLKNSRRRFTTEVESLLKIGIHDRIPKLLDYFEENLGFYVVLEFIEGHLLETELSLNSNCDQYSREQPTIRLLKDVLEILAFIHNRDIVHGNLKPDNIIKRNHDGKFTIIDFSATQPIQAPKTTNPWGESIPVHPVMTNSILGYFSLEQVQGKVHQSNDIYALGMIGIQSLTGTEPSKLQLDLETGEINWRQEFQNSETLPIFGQPLTAILSKMVKRDYRERYQSAIEVLEALEPLVLDHKIPHTLTDLPELPNPPFLYESPVEPVVDVSSPNPELIQAVIVESSSNQPQFLVEEEDRTIIQTAVKGSSNLYLFITGLGATAAVLNSLAIALGLHSLLYGTASGSEADLLHKATEAYKKGEVAEAIALAQSVSSDSYLYQESQEISQQWQEEWRFCASQYQLIQQAFQQEKWQEVILQSAKMPPISYWQKKTKPLVDKSNLELEKEAKVLLNKAYQYAANKNFTQALAYLREINPATPTGAKIQPKLAEYSEKENIRANYLLQQAYDYAAKADFMTAIQFLEQVPPHRIAGEIAQAKIEEYTKKQKIKENAQKISDINAGNTLQEINPQKTLTTIRY